MTTISSLHHSLSFWNSPLTSLTFINRCSVFKQIEAKNYAQLPFLLIRNCVFLFETACGGYETESACIDFLILRHDVRDLGDCLFMYVPLHGGAALHRGRNEKLSCKVEAWTRSVQCTKGRQVKTLIRVVEVEVLLIDLINIGDVQSANERFLSLTRIRRTSEICSCDRTFRIFRWIHVCIGI